MEAEKSPDGKNHADLKKPKGEHVENIVALSVFAVLIIIVIGLFTGGFGLFNKKDTVNRVNIQFDDDPVKGNFSGAKVIIYIFSDFECPYCGASEPAINDIYRKYDGQVALVFKNFPLVNIHPYALDAALAGECASIQGKFWEYHDYLFQHQDALTVDDLKAYAKELGMNTSNFDGCLDSKQFSYQVQRSIAEGKAAGVSGTPTFFINGIPLVGAQPESEFTSIIDAELKK
jgi:protein-disulfide isomerase